MRLAVYECKTQVHKGCIIPDAVELARVDFRKVTVTAEFGARAICNAVSVQLGMGSGGGLDLVLILSSYIKY